MARLGLLKGPPSESPRSLVAGCARLLLGRCVLIALASLGGAAAARAEAPSSMPRASEFHSELNGFNVGVVVHSSAISLTATAPGGSSATMSGGALR